ncbi:hypothetical protein [Pedobacter mendelii]|uniref:hypothetical protein n=1 Tax=Pedobacter mendelii TaxID=1908240 RepID=UPI00166C9DA8|nr:hypothetical protein [Pedobacter mendelii]
MLQYTGLKDITSEMMTMLAIVQSLLNAKNFVSKPVLASTNLIFLRVSKANSRNKQ